MILIIDNYDSFTYNLYQILGIVEPNISVVRNDAISVNEVRNLGPSHVIISPGPGRPKDAGICEQLIDELAGSLPILGICLGHQAICDVFGADIVPAPQLVHGKASRIELDNNCILFGGLPNSLMAARYHSLVAKPDSMPNVLRVIAKTDDNTVMAVEHTGMPRAAPLLGLQFHPESVLTPNGADILHNFLHIRSRMEEK